MARSEVNAEFDITRLLHPNYTSNIPANKRLAYLNFIKYNRIHLFQPEEWQKNFYNLGLTNVARGLTAGNRCGKTFGISFEIACHLTGKYPAWWEGVKYDHATNVWAVGFSIEQMHNENCLVDLLTGARNPEQWGQGFIPRCDLPTLDEVAWESRVRGHVKEIWVKHVSGGLSKLSMKTYGQGQAAYMGAMPDFIAVDEEMKDGSLWGQLVARIIKQDSGRITLTATPEYGNTDLIRLFTDDDGPYRRGWVAVSVWDCSHITPIDIDRMMQTYPPTEHDMRLRGIPKLGSGRVFPFENKDLQYDPAFEIPAHFKKVCAFDPGWQHPAAISWIAMDTETGDKYLYDCWRGSETTIGEVANILLAKGNVPLIVAHDAENSTQAGGGEDIASQLRVYGVNVIGRFHNPPDVNGRQNNHVAPGLSAMRQAMRDGVFQVKQTLTDWFSEFQLYRYTDKGKIYKVEDDLMDSTRMAFQSVNQYGSDSTGRTALISTKSKQKAKKRQR